MGHDTAPALPGSIPWRAGLRYGFMGFPLAFVALPLYVILPNYYAKDFGVPLASLGLLLLAVRLLDAVSDPLLGRLSDYLFARSRRRVLAWAAAASVALGLGFVLLFFPPVGSMSGLLVWAGVCLVWTYLAFSLLSIMHQSWGAMLGGNEAERSRWVAWREGLGLAGVVCASVASTGGGMGLTCALFLVALLAGWLCWRQATPPMPKAPGPAGAQAAAVAVGIWLPWSRPGFRALLAVFMVNGIASAVPATLLLFFVQDRLQAPDGSQALFLGIYFVAAALAIPLWLRLVRRWGLGNVWGIGMLLAVLAFVGAAFLGSGDWAWFALVCAASGVALGTDLALPAAMLAGTIAAHGDSDRAEGAYLGWWNFATKLNLALAAGLALPALGALGYTPGAQDAQALRTLTLAYCLLPCALKLMAAGLLYTLILRKTV